MEDDKLTDLFWQRKEQAIAEMDLKYGKLCRKIARNLLGSEQDAEECVNDTYLAVWNTIPPKRPQFLRAYVCRIIRNLSVKKYHSNTAQKRNSTYDLALHELEECVPTTQEGPQEQMEARELTGYLELFLDSLDQKDRILFLHRYWLADAVKDIAKQCGMTEHNAAVRLGRLRIRLRKFLEERGVEI